MSFSRRQSASRPAEPRGARWERLALEYLLAQGLSLVRRNYRCRLGEIDLLMRDREVLVVVEVRYRQAGHFGDAAASVDRHKQRRLALAARHYLGSLRAPAPPVRFDVVAVTGSAETPRLDWIRHAFDAPY